VHADRFVQPRHHGAHRREGRVDVREGRLHLVEIRCVGVRACLRLASLELVGAEFADHVAEVQLVDEGLDFFRLVPQADCLFDQPRAVARHGVGRGRQVRSEALPLDQVVAHHGEDYLLRKVSAMFERRLDPYGELLALFQLLPHRVQGKLFWGLLVLLLCHGCLDPPSAQCGRFNP
jgi:hypothetical protein